MPTLFVVVRVAAVMTAVAISGLALSPAGTAAALNVPADKIGHFVAFYVLALLTSVAFARTRLLGIAALLMAFGGAIEILQSFVGRDAQLSDLAADAVGIACALAPLATHRFRTFAEKDRSCKVHKA